MTKLFFGGFPLDADELTLARLIGPHGDISTIKIVRDKKTKKCKGYAFIEVEDVQTAANIVAALNNTFVAERQLTISINEEKQKHPIIKIGLKSIKSPIKPQTLL